MEHRTGPSNICTTLATNDNEEGEKDYSSNDEIEGNQQWEEQSTTTILHIARIVQKTTPPNNPTTSIKDPINTMGKCFIVLL